MVNDTHKQLSQLPGEMALFTLSKASAESVGARIGRLSFRGRIPFDTPHYIGITSRGVVPHISQDMFRKHTNINGVYVALEDFIEKAPLQDPPVFDYKALDGQVLRRFLALPDDNLLVLGARRTPPVTSPTSNTSSGVTILTSVGFGELSSQYFAAAAQKLKPDILVALGDIPFGKPNPGRKRMDKMSGRTAVWLNDIIVGQRGLDKTTEQKEQFAIFAPVLPISVELQRFYLDQLGDEMRSEIQGLAMYDPLSITKIPEELENLPRLSMSEPANPQCILREIQHGVDIFTIPFIGIATDAGIALDFSFPVRSAEPINGTILRKPLGIDMRPSSHARDLLPLRPGCKCYACTKHHRAYLQHLLAANEMLGWVLLQIHNHQVVDEFFAGTRASVGAETFDEDCRVFEKFYDPDLPEKTGQGPRVRGYQCKSEGPSEPKRNPTAYGRLDGVKEKPSEAISLPNPAADAKDLEDQGFAKAV